MFSSFALDSPLMCPVAFVAARGGFWLLLLTAAKSTFYNRQEPFGEFVYNSVGIVTTTRLSWGVGARDGLVCELCLQPCTRLVKYFIECHQNSYLTALVR